MRNPYSPSVSVHPEPSAPVGDPECVRCFWPTHFVTFLASFLVVWLALIIANLGISRTVAELLSAPLDLVPMVGLGVGVWCAHAILALVHRKMRRMPVHETATIGSTFFLLGMLIFDLLGRYLPRDLSISLSWTPDYVLLPLYAALSLLAVYLYVPMRSGETQRGG